LWAKERKIQMRKLAYEIDEWVSKLGGAELGLMITSWWADVNESVKWQDGFFFTLCALFALVSSAALVLLSSSLSSAKKDP